VEVQDHGRWPKTWITSFRRFEKDVSSIALMHIVTFLVAKLKGSR